MPRERAGRFLCDRSVSERFQPAARSELESRGGVARCATGDRPHPSGRREGGYDEPARTRLEPPHLPRLSRQDGEARAVMLRGQRRTPIESLSPQRSRSDRATAQPPTRADVETQRSDSFHQYRLQRVKARPPNERPAEKAWGHRDEWTSARGRAGWTCPRFVHARPSRVPPDPIGRLLAEQAHRGEGCERVELGRDDCAADVASGRDFHVSLRSIEFSTGWPTRRTAVASPHDSSWSRVGVSGLPTRPVSTSAR